MAKKRRRKKKVVQKAEPYKHPEADSPLRPDVGVQAQFKKKKKPVTYRYDSSLSPNMEWDENPAREEGEALIREILDAKDVEQAKAAAAKLKAMSKPFLNWAGKAERMSFDVPTLPLFVHERLSTKAIIETLKSHKKDKQINFLDLFGDPQRSVADQVLKAYEYRDDWVNRLILGDSLVVMNSLLHYEGLGGQVQMIYMDPPYGVKFGSNFQPFVRQKAKGDVKHNDDDSITREPEMVQAYRDTWELGVHSYLSYLRDRLLVSRELLATSGSIFVQISDENVHHVREIMDDVFGPENFVSQINFQTTSGFDTSTIATLGDFLLWYARDKAQIKVRKVFQRQEIKLGEGNARWVLLPDGSYRGVTAAEKRGDMLLPDGAKLYKPDNILSQGAASKPQPFEFDGKTYSPGGNSHWKANYPEGMNKLAEAGRIHVAKNSIQYRRFFDDFPYQEIGNFWTDTQTGSFTDEKIYVVQTNTKVAERCLLLTTDPGDLVIDPTCGSGTTAYVAEGLGRRWITIDVSRVPLALARQRLLTSTFFYFELRDESRGPASGFVYKEEDESRNPKDVGPGIAPHITLESIANDESPKPEILVDRPERVSNITRVTGPFAVEATIPTPMDLEAVEEQEAAQPEEYASFVDRMLEVLRRSPVLRLEGNRTITLKNVRPPAKTLSLSAEAMVPAREVGKPKKLQDAVQEAAEANKESLPFSDKPVAIVFGPENGAVSEKLAFEAAREAHAKSYSHLFVMGFAIQPHARKLIQECEEAVGIPATYVEVTRDIQMGDLLKNMRSSQIFSVCGLPDVKVRKVKGKKDGPTQYEVELLGLDTCDPVTMETSHWKGNDVPAWFLDTDYNGLCFHVSQAFFPRTKAWDSLKKALKATHEESVWDHLAGAESAPFEAGEYGQVAVKVIDDRGNELLVVKDLKEAEG